jgi:CDP-glucose 4,6-dehydratase
MNIELEKTYRGRRVFVTGHTGFKGSWLVAWLKTMDADVKGYALTPDMDNNLYLRINGNEQCNSVIADIRDGERLRREILGFRPDFIFHLAAQPLVKDSYRLPAYTFEVNAIGTSNVLESLLHLDKECVAVMVTTDKVYENLETGRHYREDDRLGGHDPYSASKACAELVVDSYRKSFFDPSRITEHGKSVSTARAGNVIGGGDMSKDRILPDIVRALAEGRPVELRNPGSVRPWQHVLEALHGYLWLAAQQKSDPAKFASSFNFGPSTSHTITVRELCDGVLAHWGSGESRELEIEGQQREANLLHLDIGKASRELGWKPVLKLLQTIGMTVDWYRNMYQGKDSIIDLVRSDIATYEALRKVSV